jgi:hypothetical protein
MTNFFLWLLYRFKYKKAKPPSPTEVFKRYCEENPGALECRIYDI